MFKVREFEMKQTIFTVFVLLLGFSASGFADGKASYAICITCHGPNGEGNAALNSPAIAGQEIWYLESQLNNFKSGLRGKHKDDLFGMQMGPMAMTLATDEAVSEVSAYVTAMAPAKLESSVKGSVDTGKGLYVVCSTCHGTDAKGLKTMNAPDLTLQQDWYLVRQLQNYKKSIRGTDSRDLFGNQMRPMAMILASDQAILDVVAYISSLSN